MSGVLLVGRRGSGATFGTRWPTSRLSDTAQALGLKTADDVEQEYRKAHEGWTGGTLYHCPFCNSWFWSVEAARKHHARRAHRVLRVDWYEQLPQVREVLGLDVLDVPAPRPSCRLPQGRR